MGTLHTVRYRQPQTYQVYQKDHNGLLTHIGSPGGCLPHGSPPPTSSEVTEATATVWPEASVDTAMECPVWACGELDLATDIPALVLAMATDWAAMDSDSVSALPQLLASPLSVWELELAKLTKSNHHPQHFLISDCICLL